MYAGVSGMQAHMDKMDIVGNNISNVNTTGYKSSRATFKTMLSQTIQGASAPQDDRGGTNPKQIGLGTTLGSIDKDMGQGNLKSTGRNTDLAIQGNGFFVLNDGGANKYTRSGSMSFDKDGYLVNSTNGYRLQGWQADASGNVDTNGELEDITLKQNMDANATTEVTYAGNLDGNAAEDDTRTTTMNVYDSQGSEHTVELDFTKNSNPNEWSYEVTNVSDSDNVDDDSGTLEFDSDGNVTAGGTSTLEFDPAGGGGDGQQVTLDFTQMTQQAGDMTADVDTIDGYQSGSLEKFSIGQSGEITGFYDNGKRQTVGQVAVADFNNPGGLNEDSDTMFSTSNNSGPAQIGSPNTGGFGSLSAGTLEMSNVDLSRQFSEMITTQRGFQANSKTISTSDKILQQLVNLKR